jgi:hypothetical protein
MGKLLTLAHLTPGSNPLLPAIYERAALGPVQLWVDSTQGARVLLDDDEVWIETHLEDG